MTGTHGFSELFSAGRIDAARDLLLSPGSDSRASFIIGMFIAIMVLLVLLVALFIFVPRLKIKTISKKRFVPADQVGKELENLPIIYRDRDGNILDVSRDGKEKLKDLEPAKKRMSTATFTLIAAILTIAVLAITYGYATSNSFCASACHDNSASVQKAARIDHADCVACHVGGRWSAPVANTSFVVSRAVLLFGGHVKKTPVLTQNCLSCHKKILDQTTESDNGIRMKHKEPLERGENCVACHSELGHVEGSGYEQQMDKCLACHNDGDTEVLDDMRYSASTKCPTCHSERLALSPQQSRSKSIVFATVPAGTLECKRCHDLKASCNPCHGLELPHPKSFLEHDHARIAAFEGKKLCWRCHTEYNTCSKCHDSFSAHLSNWKEVHKTKKNWKKCGGSGCHRQIPAGRDVCAACHTHYK